jgi:hypothetical protein
VIPGRRPGVVLAFRIWCGLFVAIYLGMCAFELLVARGSVESSFGLLEDFASRHDKNLRDSLIAEKRAEAPGFAAFVFAIAVGYGVAAAIPCKPWAWVFGIVVLATTVFPFVVTAAGMVPLLVYWGRPEVKRYFGRRA